MLAIAINNHGDGGAAGSLSTFPALPPLPPLPGTQLEHLEGVGKSRRAVSLYSQAATYASTHLPPSDPLVTDLASALRDAQDAQGAVEASPPPAPPPASPRRAKLVLGGDTYGLCGGIYEEKTATLIQGRSIWVRLNPNNRFIWYQHGTWMITATDYRDKIVRDNGCNSGESSGTAVAMCNP